MMVFLIVITFVFGAGYVLLINKYAHLWKSLEISNSAKLVGVKASLVVVFRNEAQHLPRLFNSITALNTAGIDLEVVLVNDHSSDESLSQANAFVEDYGATVISLDKTKGKKAGVQKGWELCTGTFIIQTDADCILPSEWLQVMLNELTSASFVSGPVTYIKHTSLFQNLLRLDFAGLIAIGAAHIAWGKPLMCNGANLGFRRECLSSVNLQTSRASGDDVFLMQSISAQGGVVRFCKNKQALVQTEAPSNWKAWVNQRLRWASKNGVQDHKGNLAILWFVWLYNSLCLLSFLSLTSIGVTIGLVLLLVKLLAEDHLFSKLTDFFDLEKPGKTLFIGQVFHITYMTLIPLFSQLIPYTWKDRKLK